MRLDKFLYFIRITKSRALAQKIIAAGHIRVDGQPVTLSRANVAIGQVITVPVGDAVRVLQIDLLPARRGPAAEAQTHYHDPRIKVPIDASDP
jgi:ribosome-associated heat shock protein Hsp15